MRNDERTHTRMNPAVSVPPSISGTSSDIVAEPVPIQWDETMPVFAKEEFLRAVGDRYGWLGGFDQDRRLRCILPYTVLRKSMFRLVRFRSQTIPCDGKLDLIQEKHFLNSVVQFFRRARADVIIPPSNNAIFRTYPDGADAAPYGTYVIDLRQPEEVLWSRCNKTSREAIRKAKRDGVSIHEGSDYLKQSWLLIRQTFARSHLPFMSAADFSRFILGLGRHGKLMVAVYQGVLHTCRLFGYSNRAVYVIYSGNVHDHHKGSSKLLYWDAMCTFRNLGVQCFDFYGARIAPTQGSKQHGINLVKAQLGATLHEGFIWKSPIRPLRSLAYSMAVRILRGGDIVDTERWKLKGFAKATSAPGTLRIAG